MDETGGYLTITYQQETHVYSSKDGKRKDYRHAWQIKDWLKSRFGIEPASWSFKKIEYQ
ncbi:MAG: hypothetical protein HC904_13730 [Blastochloris sp.]|nr:hypothetical protein [Blastochloris sp.]